MSAFVEVRGVSKTFRRPGRDDEGVVALSDVSFAIEPGEFVCLLGPSGCGKTTLLRMINGLIPPDSGEVVVDGQRNPQPGPWAGFVFQSFRLLPWLTVQDNVQFPLEIQGMEPRRRRARAGEYVRLVGLERFAKSYPHELSGGMQQRVALARALAMEPSVLLMDEPFAALDAQTREFMQIELSRIWAARKIAVVFVTHSLDEALFLADRLILLRPRPGQVEEILEVPLARPRWEYDVHAQPEYVEMRAHLWQKIRQMVADQPDFRSVLAVDGPGAGSGARS
jgi:NitT/TauT family transport system ATP-binding protein